MASRKTKFTIKLQPSNQLSHLSALSWGMDDDPPMCRSSQCRTNKNVIWDEGEWKCTKCNRIVDPD
ncbi:hypothetical protein SAMN05444392_11124 [Seinonella peptonophila]|uniref:Uncharacterized protein n=1 Tax=Seinonella peptonophila TaxID=112248 RepID=A0A1M4ZWV3_9BACL|nr:hypothetical protein SAMN05444392_11124 [Seinonella peptonophila]